MCFQSLPGAEVKNFITDGVGPIRALGRGLRATVGVSVVSITTSRASSQFDSRFIVAQAHLNETPFDQ